MNEQHEDYVAAPAAPRPKRRLPRVALVAVGALLVAGAGFGTFASFSASTSNDGTFATGSLVLSNKVGTAATCFSTGAGVSTDVNDQACDALFTTTAAAPGDTATVNLTLKNEGSLTGSALQAYAAGTCANTANLVATYTGSGNLCTAVQLTIQEYSDAGRTTVSACRYGNATVTNTCDFGDATKTVAGVGSPAFGFLYPSSGQSLGMGAFNAGASRWFTIGVKVPSSADNTYQGRQAAFSIKWTLVQ